MSEAPERIRAFAEPPDNDVDMGGDKNAIGIEYIRADIHKARIKELEEQVKDERSCLKAWFDTRKLAHDAVDGAVLDAAKAHLRTCRVGGMCEWESLRIEAVFADMARLSVFADLFARTKMPLPNSPNQRKGGDT
jgi:hypothetical protein